MIIIAEYRTLNGKAVIVPNPTALPAGTKKKAEVTIRIRLKVKFTLLVIFKDA